MFANRTRLSVLALVAALATVSMVTPRQLAAQTPADREAVRLAVLDYVEGIYLAQPDRIRKSVSPDLAKLGMSRSARDTTGQYRSVGMTFNQLIDIANTYAKNTTVPANAPKKIDVYDVLDRTASVKLTAVWGTDYMLLARRDDGRWMITHVLWQSPLR